MPPKKKKGKKKLPVLIDGVDTSNMTRDQLEAFSLRIKDELEREREERNFFQLERDKIRTFWEISRTQLEEATYELRHKDHEIEIAQEVADTETKHIVQQMKHLQYENHMKIGEARADSLAQLKIAQEKHVAMELQLLRDKRELRKMLREREDTCSMQIQQLKLQHNEDLAKARISFEREIKDMEVLHNEKMGEQKAELELIYRMQMFEVEERKNQQIARLVQSHDEAFNNMKNYYNDITLNNLGLITLLKDEMETLRHQAERSDRTAADMVAENRKLKEPLEQAQTELEILRRKLEHFERDRNQLLRLKNRNAYVEKQLKSLTWETETLLLRNETLTKQRENLKSKFEDIVTELQHKTGLKNVVLERKITLMEQESEKREAVLKTRLDQYGCNIEQKKKLREYIDSIINDKNKEIEELRYELVRAIKAHDQVLDTYEAKLVQFGIPKEELGFEPLRLATKFEYVSGPAGLITRND